MKKKAFYYKINTQPKLKKLRNEKEDAREERLYVAILFVLFVSLSALMYMHWQSNQNLSDKYRKDLEARDERIASLELILRSVESKLPLNEATQLNIAMKKTLFKLEDEQAKMSESVRLFSNEVNKYKHKIERQTGNIIGGVCEAMHSVMMSTRKEFRKRLGEVQQELRYMRYEMPGMKKVEEVVKKEVRSCLDDEEYQKAMMRIMRKLAQKNGELKRTTQAHNQTQVHNQTEPISGAKGDSNSTVVKSLKYLKPMIKNVASKETEILLEQVRSDKIDVKRIEDQLMKSEAAQAAYGASQVKDAIKQVLKALTDLEKTKLELQQTEKSRAERAAEDRKRMEEVERTRKFWETAFNGPKTQKFSNGEFMGMKKPHLYIFFQDGIHFFKFSSYLVSSLPFSEIVTLDVHSDWVKIQKYPYHAFLLYVASEAQKVGYTHTDTYRKLLLDTQNNTIFVNLRSADEEDKSPKFAPSHFSGVTVEGEKRHVVSFEFRHRGLVFYEDESNRRQLTKLGSIYTDVLRYDWESFTQLNSTRKST